VNLALARVLVDVALESWYVYIHEGSALETVSFVLIPFGRVHL